MSFPSGAPSSSSHSGSVLDVALTEYRKNTGKDLLSHPLAIELQRCDSIDGILAILQRQTNTVEQLRDGNRGLMKWIGPSVHILCSFSGTLGDALGVAFPAAKPIFTGIGVLLAAAKDVSASHDVVIDLFKRIESFFKRLKIYSQRSLEAELTEVLEKVVVNVLNILSVTTKEIEQSRTKKFLKQLGDFPQDLESLDYFPDRLYPKFIICKIKSVGAIFPAA